MTVVKNKIKIVLVEDDQFLSKILMLRLVGEGFDVVLADNGQDAAGVIKKEKPNIVLLDLLLPKKNGFEVLEEVKLDANINQIPVIILSNLCLIVFLIKFL